MMVYIANSNRMSSKEKGLNWARGEGKVKRRGCSARGEGKGKLSY